MNAVQCLMINGLVCLLGFSACAPAPEELSIIPQPVEIKLGRGSFTFGPQTQIVVNESFRDVALLLREQLALDMGFQLELLTASGKSQSNTVVLELTPPGKDTDS